AAARSRPRSRRAARAGGEGSLASRPSTARRTRRRRRWRARARPAAGPACRPAVTEEAGPRWIQGVLAGGLQGGLEDRALVVAVELGTMWALAVADTRSLHAQGREPALGPAAQQRGHRRLGGELDRMAVQPLREE